MGRTKSTGIALTPGDEGGNSPPRPGYDPIEREPILSNIGASYECNDFETLVDTAQKISIEMYLNQAAICLKLQTDYMNRTRPLLPIEDFRILNICSDLMRELTAYDVGVDTNRAWEFLERQGYKITDGSDENEDSSKMTE